MPRPGLALLALVVATFAAATAGHAHHEAAASLPDFELVLEQREGFLAANEVFLFANPTSAGYDGPVAFWLPAGSAIVGAAIMDAAQTQTLHEVADLLSPGPLESDHTLFTFDLGRLNMTLEPGATVRIHVAYRVATLDYAKRPHEDVAHGRVRVVPLPGWDARSPEIELTLVDAPRGSLVYGESASPLALDQDQEMRVQFVPRAAAAGPGWGTLVGVFVGGLLVGGLVGRALSR